MKRTLVSLVGALLVVALTMPAQPANAQPGPGGYCGPGGMMGGWGPGPWSGGGQPGVTISMDQAIQAAQGYVARFGNPDLALDEAMEFECNFYFIVKEQSTGVGAFEVLVSRFNGAVFPEPGPNMMWNTKYGMMGGGGPGMMGRGGMMGGPGADGLTYPTGTPLTADQAGQVAQQWLDSYQPGTMIESPDSFYGYYTVHFKQGDSVAGMLSVNAYTGQVWYHNWHGAFIGERELG